MKKDLIIAYRIYPGISKVPPVFSDNKLKLAELCLKSFIDALGNINFKIIAILDNCPDIYVELFNKYIKSKDLEIIRTPLTGNAGTFGLQMNLLLNQDTSDVVFFAEDDYFYLPDTIKVMLDFINSNNKPDFLTPFDHLDYYTHPMHDKIYRTINHNEFEWREAATTCMTFMTRKDTLQATKNIFYTYAKKNYDNSLWLALTKTDIFSPAYHFKLFREYDQYPKFLAKLTYFSWMQLLTGKRYKLFAPKPSLATHMDNICLAPDIDWYSLFNNQSEKINFLNL
jgi:hypothetical protein